MTLFYILNYFHFKIFLITLIILRLLLYLNKTEAEFPKGHFAVWKKSIVTLDTWL